MAKVMRGKCTVCGSSQHTKETAKHTDLKCNHCGKDGHWSKVCVRRLQGLPRTTEAKPRSISATGTDPEAETAALKDLIETQNKQIKTLSEQLKLSF